MKNQGFKFDLSFFNDLFNKYKTILKDSSLKKTLEKRGLQSVRDAKRRIDKSQDVRGTPFAPIKSERRPLFRSGNLYNSFGFKSSGTRLRIFNSVSYFSFHNFGTKYIVRRQTLDQNTEVKQLETEINKKLDSVKGKTK